MVTIKRNRFKNLIISILMLFIFMTIPLYFIYENINDLIKRDIGNEAKKIAVTISVFMEEEIDMFEKLSYTEDIYESNMIDYYNRIQELLYNIRKNTNVEYVYITKKISEDKIMYLVDGQDKNSDSFSPMASLEASNKYMDLVYESKSELSTEIENYERWGKLITGYSPIKGAKENIVAVVGVDISLDTINELRKPVNRIIVIGGGIFNLIGIIILNNMLNSRCDAVDIDSLTGLLNKRNLDYYLKKAIKKSKSKNKNVCLMMIDVDEFKGINDRYGHLLGDGVLKNIGMIITESTRSSDMCFRFGGDEFIIILPYADINQAKEVGNRIMEKIRKSININSCGENIGITLSIGLAQWENGMEIDRLIELADENMYEAKSRGKNKVI